MNITMRYCKPTLVTALVSLIISISALMEIQADEHGQTGSGILMLEPVTVPEYYRQLHVGDSEHILRYSTIVEDSEMRKIYSTPDGGAACKIPIGTRELCNAQ